MSPYSTPSLSSASSSETAVAESQAQLLERSGSALKAPKSSKKTPQEWSPELRQAIAQDIDGFFGGPEPVKVKKPKAAVPKAPRADRGQSASNSLGSASPPPYELPPHLAPTPKPQTVARSFFLYGFIFPPFWVIGACILGSKLRPDSQSALEPSPKEIEAGAAGAPSEAHKRAEHNLVRHTELLWAKRCLIATILFVLAIVVIIVATRVAGVGAFAESSFAAYGSGTMPTPHD
ncbi:unnamed protein product [Rhizoctonia solani]|uniref:Transmembrane protein n=3 Tax=Rhizoctonia solani TaxID=456999 RepID=A0A8H2WF96_9AGAM|nr:transmembrane protein, putative [Rhizoctonia solani AG-3 Rhs1AP]KEP53829.1 putative transmembrane protein [Rhizoctonia solani 123E]CAE6378022.1 unnamed protein product [Rhizoctonia solani]CAE6413134.1 unnamed protein product [Rhizoctonia solani]